MLIICFKPVEWKCVFLYNLNIHFIEVPVIILEAVNRDNGARSELYAYYRWWGYGS
jgi:hypothetical protein